MPFPFVPQPGCVLQPDLQVLNPEQSEDHRTVVAPLLVVEVGDDYRVVADVRGEDTATLERPFPVTVTPARLVDRSR